MFDLFGYSLSYPHLALIFLVAFLIGMAKTGVHGTALFAVPILAVVFGGKTSVGLMLPLMIFADFFAVKYYHRDANWNYLFKLFPSAAIGIFVGTWLGDEIDDQVFVRVMSGIVFTSLILMIWMKRLNKDKIPDYLWFAVVMGFLGGVATMIGNLAGPLMALYLLSMGLPKNEYIGTAAWFFLVVNLFKVPFHVLSWHTITVDSFLLSLSGLPFIAIGAWSGLWVVKRIQEKHYRWLVICMTAIASVSMLF